jgi:HEAT repeat protein
MGLSFLRNNVPQDGLSMSPTNIVLLVSLVVITSHKLPAQTSLNAVSADLKKACDPNYKPSRDGSDFSRLMPFSVALCEYGIDTSEPSLIAALKNSDPEVRSLAAAELAEKQLTEKQDDLAKPAIENAVSAETNIRARINIAASLMSMDDPVGVKVLNGMCINASLPVEDTVTVVQQIAIADHSTAICADVVLNAIEHASQDYERMYLLTVFPSMYKDVPKEKAGRMVTVAQNLLGSQDVTTRMRASQALAEMGSTASIDLIRTAIINETNPDIRAWHQPNLDKLLNLLQQGAPTAPAKTPQH